jgi:hypothetical protein
MLFKSCHLRHGYRRVETSQRMGTKQVSFVGRERVHGLEKLAPLAPIFGIKDLRPW